MSAAWEPITAEEVSQVLKVDDNILAYLYNCITISELIPIRLVHQ